MSGDEEVAQPNKRSKRLADDKKSLVVEWHDVQREAEEAREAEADGLWYHLIKQSQAHHAAEGRFMPPAALRALVKRDQVDPRFLALPSETRQCISRLVWRAMCDYAESQGDETKLIRRVHHSFYLGRVRLLRPRDGYDAPPDVVAVRLPHNFVPGVVQCTVHEAFAEYLYDGERRIKGWHLWQNPEGEQRLKPSFRRGVKQPTKPEYDDHEVLEAVVDIFERTGEAALPAAVIIPRLAERGITLNHPRKLAKHLAGYGIETVQTWLNQAGTNRKCYLADTVYNEAVYQGIYADEWP